MKELKNLTVSQFKIRDKKLALLESTFSNGSNIIPTLGVQRNEKSLNSQHFYYIFSLFKTPFEVDQSIQTN